MSDQKDSQEFHPELVSRRGELIAWGSALLVNGAWIILILSPQKVTLWVPILAVPLTLVAFGISLGNWMDRHTIIKMCLEDIYYSNGLRRVRLQWHDIQEVRVLPAQWGKKIQVFGNQSYFGFHTIAKVKVDGRELGRTGFRDGDLILIELLERAKLVVMEDNNSGNQSEGYYYYTRK